MSLATSGGIPSARIFAHVRKNFLSPAARPSIGSNVPPQSHPGPLPGKLPAPCSGGSSDPCFSLFRFLPWRFRASRTGLKTGHYKEDLTARRASPFAPVRAGHGIEDSGQQPARGRQAGDTRSSSTGVRLTKRLSPKSPNFPAAPPTERLTRKRSPTWKSSFRNGSKPPKNSAAPSPPRAAASPSLKSQRPHPLKYQMPKGAPPKGGFRN